MACDCRADGVQVVDINLNREIEIELPEALEQYIQENKKDKSTLINVLHKVQEEYGYIPEDVALKVSQEMNITLANIYGVVTFYHLFSFRKPGKFTIQVCTGTACYLKGAKDIVRELEGLLGVKVGGTTENKLFTLETVRCIGCCGLAPAVLIGEDTYGNLTKDDLPGMLAKYTEKAVRE